VNSERRISAVLEKGINKAADFKQVAPVIVEEQNEIVVVTVYTFFF
jgi:hypothetical protein